MKTSHQGIVALICHEGIVPAPYLDSVGVWTFGIGHAETSGLDPNPAQMPRAYPANMDLALREVFRVFLADLPKYESDVLRAVKVPLKQHQFDALVSWHFNTGAAGKASLIKVLNSGNYAAAGRGLMDWKKPPEIIPRRREESKLFLTGEYPHGRATVWRTDGKGRMIWKPKAVLSDEEVFALLNSVTPQKAPPSAPKPIAAPTPAPKAQSPWAAIFRGFLAMFGKGGGK